MADLGSFNLVVLIGKVATEIKQRPAGEGASLIAWFNLATNELWRDGKDHAYFHRIVCYGRTAKVMIEYGSVGRLICVVGRYHPRCYVDKSGAKRYMHEIQAEQIIFLERRKKDEEEKLPEDATENLGGESDGNEESPF